MKFEIACEKTANETSSDSPIDSANDSQGNEVKKFNPKFMGTQKKEELIHPVPKISEIDPNGVIIIGGMSK